MKEMTRPNGVEISQIQIENENFFKITNSDIMRPFFMSIVSHSNHWMFISSNGGLSAGRKNSESALFPYYTDDKITESKEITGSKSIFEVRRGDKTYLWEPFSDRNEGRFQMNRNLYKNVYGNKILFEEVNHDLELTFRYQWNSSDRFGFIRKSNLINNSNQEVQCKVLDGIQNILPNGVGSDLQNSTSNLVDAYKRSELETETGIGIYTLSAIIVDKAEPSESLKANIAWSVGFDNANVLLSSLQLKNFRKGHPIIGEEDVKAEKGAYLIHAEVDLLPHSEKKWMIIADVNQNHSAIARLSKLKSDDSDLLQLIEQDIELGSKQLIELNAAADGLQLTADHFRDTRHFANALFNIMRGGIFDDNYSIEKQDLNKYLFNANREVLNNAQESIQRLDDVFSIAALQKMAYNSDDAHFRRLCLEYLPLKFSRRHGDPSRPWNKFSINTRDENDGSKILDYEGNWRDIFQNWEALALAYPAFLESMIHKFLNATTFDGYNPYRVTKDGFDWEAIEADDPWSYIGYWGDHQIIYLLKFLELLENHHPGRLADFLEKDLFVYANVPYRIKSYNEIQKNPKDTIDFEHDLDRSIHERKAEMGADGALLQNISGSIHQVNFVEKILATVLAKMSNFIPEGGIWMNTQRPEWNDANNALVGNGVSMVTLNYLRRFLKFFESILANAPTESVFVSKELVAFYHGVKVHLDENQNLLSDRVNDTDRKSVLDGLGEAGSQYRLHIYEHSFSAEKQAVTLVELKDFVDLSLRFLEHSILANRRADGLYHAYNLMTLSNEHEVSISFLSEMLEGQVAVLSSGFLSSEETVQVLDSLKSSALFRKDQYSYILYPNKDLPRFSKKNVIPASSVERSALLKKLVQDGNTQVIEKDVKGLFHFNGNFNNAKDLVTALDELAQSEYRNLIDKDRGLIFQFFEEIFDHKSFTGRSGTFFGYEGLGSIYWHMVSKLLLAVQECCLKAIEEGASEMIIGKLLEHYYEINEGIGVHKPPTLYGAFPTDPYSHTPAGKGAQQPGMTGQVKEDILCRFGELGVFVKGGKLYFNPCLLRKREFLLEPKSFNYVNVDGEHLTLDLGKGSLCFTYCQVPIIYKLSDSTRLQLNHNDDTSTTINARYLSVRESKQIFERNGKVSSVIVQIDQTKLR